MDNPAWLAWLLVVAALVILVLLLAGRSRARDEDLEVALRWQERQNRRARAVTVAAAADRPRTAETPSSPAEADRGPVAATAALAAPLAPAKPKQDDLTRLKGVGPRLAELLIAAGVTRFDQIAEWSEEDVARIDQSLGAFSGRVQRDDWVGQARLLAAGDDAAFAERYGCG